MRTTFMILFSSWTLLLSCDNSTKKTPIEKSESPFDILQQDSIITTDPLEEILKTIPKKLNPVLGYRFIISGDFDGDGKKEILTEHFFSGLDNKETNKFFDGLSDYSQLVALTIKKEPYSFVISDNKTIDTLYISSGGQLLGLSYLKNEGDLNGDGTDEVSYVIKWADFSNMNTWYLITYKNNKWVKLYSFSIWDWQIPYLPDTSNDILYRETEKELREFEGLIKKIKVNTIQVILRTNDAEMDTVIVNLSLLN